MGALIACFITGLIIGFVICTILASASRADDIHDEIYKEHLRED